jgi:RND family efflux transporter MFP subunit
MKKILVLAGAALIFALIIITLFLNRAEKKQEARGNFKISYPVAVVTASKRILNRHLTQVGLITANSDINVISQLQGQVKTVLAREGSYIAAGSPIVKLDDQVPAANFLSAQTNYQKMQKDWERANDLHKQELISDSQLESARLAFKAAEAQYIAAQQNYHNSVITSPISGIIASLPIEVGTTVNQGMIVANVVDISKLRVKINIPEQEVFKLKTGDQAVVETSVYPGIKFYGKIESISVKGDDAHTYPVKIVIPNNNRYPLKSGMFGQVTFNLGNQVGLTIPRDTLIGSIENPQIFVVEDGKAQLRNIEVGSEVDTHIVVLKGLREGETVIIKGQDNLKDHATVTIQNDLFDPNAASNFNNTPSNQLSHRSGSNQES